MGHYVELYRTDDRYWAQIVRLKTDNNPKIDLNYLDGEGHLVQEASKRQKGGEWRFASGRMSSSGLVSPIYGFFETRMSTLPTEGMLSAWWMWGENGNYDYSARNDKARFQ